MPLHLLSRRSPLSCMRCMRKRNRPHRLLQNLTAVTRKTMPSLRSYACPAPTIHAQHQPRTGIITMGGQTSSRRCTSEHNISGDRHLSSISIFLFTLLGFDGCLRDILFVLLPSDILAPANTGLVFYIVNISMYPVDMDCRLRFVTPELIHISSAKQRPSLCNYVCHTDSHGCLVAFVVSPCRVGRSDRNQLSVPSSLVYPGSSQRQDTGDSSRRVRVGFIQNGLSCTVHSPGG